MNALGIILVMSQLETFKECVGDYEHFDECPVKEVRWASLASVSTWMSLFIVALTMIVMWLSPKIPRLGHLVPPSLVAIILSTIFEWCINRPLIHADTRTIGDTSPISGGIPPFRVPSLPSNTNWGIIMQYAVSLCFIGLIETVMTIEFVNQYIKVKSSNFATAQECYVQSIANLLCGFFGAVVSFDDA